ncbi:unnamed protein product [Rotaria magnacalcarata]|uniref:Ubiquitin-like domain-containing protein n=7 Tax=Rotaria magnacalcarata TaxID=392030 RepID=A0A815PB83_9BILA|nr:unnamed protein product [Rotaria magnacalcarata]CAF1589399.1 unnamed protein product [Rotaria magnacalcarata]CAF1965767.1 unnamed protein product [Rotaria magnacalcarata]CAF2117394.1 unnamed protein product [Rotaria magnacalcarata]CAF3792303.1 unnamed protein product [Rotaria magnacalcarata]
MSIGSSTDDNEQVLAAALSAILGKSILPESSVSEQSQQHISKISIFDQHLACFIYGKVGQHDTNSDESFMTLYITILATKTTFPCVIECDATVDKLKQIIYEKEGLLRSKQNLIHCGQEIDEGHLLSEYDIQDSSQITVVRLRSMDTDLLVLDKNSLDSKYDYDFTNINDNGKTFTRGSIEYRRPCGWKRFAIRVAGKYDDEIWLGSSNNSNEWPVSYHGTKHDAVNSIAQMGYDLTKHKRFVHGRGIYSTPDVNIAKGFAKSFVKDGQQYLVILQNRVNPKTLVKLLPDKTGNGEYWISPDATDIRPYGVCIMKKT